MKPETQLSKAIQDALEGMGALVVRVQSGTIPTMHGRIHAARPGTPDLYVAWRGSQGWLEVKTQAKKSQTNEAQDYWHTKAQSHGVRVEVVRSVEAAVRAVKGWAG